MVIAVGSDLFVPPNQISGFPLVAILEAVRERYPGPRRYGKFHGKGCTLRRHGVSVTKLRPPLRLSGGVDKSHVPLDVLIPLPTFLPMMVKTSLTI
jgi:hypothetical protein